MKYIIRPAEMGDEKGIAKVHIQSWCETYKGIVSDEYLKSLDLRVRTIKWREKLSEADQSKFNLVATDFKRRIIGLVSGGKARECDDRFQGELYAIYILKEHQGKGLGYRLVKELCSKFKEHGIKNMYVCALQDNPSKEFYKKYGAKIFKETSLKIGDQTFIQEYYGWENLNKFIK